MKNSRGDLNGFGYLLVTLGCVVLIALMGVGGFAGCGAVKSWHRGQARADAKNNVQVSLIKAHNSVALTKIQVQNQQQYSQVISAHNAVVKAQAYQRYLASVGIREAQDEIRKTLTPLYIQHEAIQAEENVATSGRNNTIVYVPSGPQGVPLVQTPPFAQH